jgi:hypothetical protein
MSLGIGFSTAIHLWQLKTDGRQNIEEDLSPWFVLIANSWCDTF